MHFVCDVGDVKLDIFDMSETQKHMLAVVLGRDIRYEKCC